jgi:hypothetical protein
MSPVMIAARSPKWHDYIDEARKFMVVYDALNS